MSEKSRLSGSGQGVHGVAFSPDSRRILSGDADGTMRLWDLHTKKLLRRFEGHGPMVNSVSFTAAGRQALSGGSDKTLRLWTLPKPEGAHK